ncbi:MAG: hypothetical protein ACXACY_30550 [Candidatus Hodarchaeales archaeon]|jgi:hypothetical protein
MKKTLAYNILIILAFIGGLYIGNYKVDSFSINQIYLHSSLDLIPTVLILKRLRENRFSETIKLLEMKLDGMLIDLKDYDELSVDKRDKMIIRSIKIAKEYRSNYPRRTDNIEIEKAIEKTLSLVD